MTEFFSRTPKWLVNEFTKCCEIVPFYTPKISRQKCVHTLFLQHLVLEDNFAEYSHIFSEKKFPEIRNCGGKQSCNKSGSCIVISSPSRLCHKSARCSNWHFKSTLSPGSNKYISILFAKLQFCKIRTLILFRTSVQNTVTISGMRLVRDLADTPLSSCPGHSTDPGSSPGQTGIALHIFIKGTISRDFRLLFFSMNQFPTSP